MHGSSTFTCAVALPAEPPDWVHLMPLGELDARDGRSWRLDDPAAVIEASKALAMDLPIDFDHVTDLAPPGTQAPAAGWIKSLEVRNDGIWGQVEWTEKGAAAIRAKEYRYLSPVFDAEKKTGRVGRIYRAGLTNNPALHLKAVASAQRKEATMEDVVKAVAKSLGLKEDADEASIAKAAETVAQEHSDAVSALAVIASAAGLKPDEKKPAELASAIATRLKEIGKTAEPDPSKYVSVATFTELAEKHTALEKSIASKDAGTAVEAAIAAGRLTPAERDWALAYATQDRAGFDKHVEKRPAIFKPGSEIPSGKPPTGADGLTEHEKAVASAIGISPDELKKERARLSEKETA